MCLRVEGGGFFSSADKTRAFSRNDFEEQEVEFLYRHVNSYAYGHGISVAWDAQAAGPVLEVRTEAMPHFFQEQVDTKVEGLSLGMLSLAKASKEELALSLQALVDGYSTWIEKNDSMSESLPLHQLAISKRLTAKSRKISGRMQKA